MYNITKICQQVPTLPELPDLFSGISPFTWGQRLRTGFQTEASLIIKGFIIIALVKCTLQRSQKKISMSFNLSATQVIAIPDAETSQDGPVRV